MNSIIIHSSKDATTMLIANAAAAVDKLLVIYIRPGTN